MAGIGSKKYAHNDVSGGCFGACGGAGDVVYSDNEEVVDCETEADRLLELGRLAGGV